jgi:cell division protein FtsB
MTLRRILWIAIIVTAAVFAVQGGEYSSADLFSQSARQKQLEVRIAGLKHEVDSLEAVKKAVLTDPAVQERIAREEWGYVRGSKELLYRFTSPRDST